MKPALLSTLFSLAAGLSVAAPAHADDAGPEDPLDAGFVDAIEADGGFLDVGSLDAGALDGEETDVGASDVEPVDDDVTAGAAGFEASTPLEREWETACAADGSAYALRVDERVYPTCELVFGGSTLRERHEAERRSRVLRVSASGGRLDILHQDPTLQAPKVRALDGLEVVSVLDAEVEELDCAEGGPVEASDVERDEAEDARREQIALVRLREPFSAFCPADLYAMRVDDALGADGHVVALDPRGMLAFHRGELLWVPRDGDVRAPQFRLTWRSDFVLIVEDQKSKKAPKRRTRRRRRRGRR